MDPIFVGILGVVLMIVLLMLGVPLPVTFFCLGFGGMVLLKGWGPTLITLQTVPYGRLADFSWSVVPLFILLGMILFECDIGREIFRAMGRWLGHLAGGMAAAVSVACAFLGTMTGSGIAANALMCRVAYPELRRLNYEPALSLAVCASSSTVAIMIPPSTSLVIYAIITEKSIGECLLAGFIPGFLSMAIYAIMIFIRARFNPNLGPPAPVSTWRDRFVDLKYLMPAIIMIVTVVGGIYFGIFTATEAGAAAVLVAFIIALSLRRLNRARLKTTIYETAKLSIMTLIMLMTIIGFYNLFLNITWLPQTMAEMVLDIYTPWLVIAAIFIVAFILGMFTGSPMAVVLLPLLTPVVEELGFSPIWFILTMVKMMEVATITPPVAFGVFIAQGIIKEVPLEKAYGGIWWFVLCDVLTLGLMIAFPQIVTFLPNTMK